MITLIARTSASFMPDLDQGSNLIALSFDSIWSVLYSFYRMHASYYPFR